MIKNNTRTTFLTTSKNSRLLSAILTTAIVSLLLLGVGNQAYASQIPAACTSNSIGSTLDVTPTNYIGGVAQTFEIRVDIENTGGTPCIVTIDPTNANEQSIVSLPDSTGMNTVTVDLVPSFATSFNDPATDYPGHMPTFVNGEVQIPVNAEITFVSGSGTGHLCADVSPAPVGLCVELGSLSHSVTINTGVAVSSFITDTRGTWHGVSDLSPTLPPPTQCNLGSCAFNSAAAVAIPPTWSATTDSSVKSKTLTSTFSGVIDTINIVTVGTGPGTFSATYSVPDSTGTPVTGSCTGELSMLLIV